MLPHELLIGERKARGPADVFEVVRPVLDGPGHDLDAAPLYLRRKGYLVAGLLSQPNIFDTAWDTTIKNICRSDSFP